MTPCCLTGDVDGSVEAILDTLDSYMSEQCTLHILQYGVGAVTEQDVDMAANFGGRFWPFKADPLVIWVTQTKN